MKAKQIYLQENGAILKNQNHHLILKVDFTGSDSDDDIGKKKKRVVREAFGSDGEAGSGSDNEAGSNKKRKRIMAGSDSEDEDVNKEKTNEEASEDAPKPAEGEEGASGKVHVF